MPDNDRAPATEDVAPAPDRIRLMPLVYDGERWSWEKVNIDSDRYPHPGGVEYVRADLAANAPPATEDVLRLVLALQDAAQDYGAAQMAGHGTERTHEEIKESEDDMTAAREALAAALRAEHERARKAEEALEEASRALRRRAATKRSDGNEWAALECDSCAMVLAQYAVSTTRAENGTDG